MGIEHCTKKTPACLVAPAKEGNCPGPSVISFTILAGCIDIISKGDCEQPASVQQPRCKVLGITGEGRYTGHSIALAPHSRHFTQQNLKGNLPLQTASGRRCPSKVGNRFKSPNLGRRGKKLQHQVIGSCQQIGQQAQHQASAFRVHWRCAHANQNCHTSWRYP